MRGPALFEPLADACGQLGISGELGSLGTSSPHRGRGLRRLGVITTSAATLVELAMDRRAVPPQASRHLRDADALR